MDMHRQPTLAAFTAGLVILASALTGCGQPVGQPQGGTTVTVTAPASSPPASTEDADPGSSQPTDPEDSAPAEEPVPGEESLPAEEPVAPEEPLPAEEPSSAEEPADLALSPTPAPTISGVPSCGHTLVAHAGPWGPGDVTLTYQWYRSGAAISGATHSTYPLVAADVSETIKVRVSGSKPGYATARKYSSATGPVVAGTLVALVPTITGTAKVGRRLWAVPGEWGPAPVDVQYRWYRDGSVITGADDSSYLLGAADLGKRMRVVVIGQKAGYATTGRPSAMTDPVEPGTLTFAPTPSLPSTKRVGQNLDGQVTWMPIPVIMHYQWFRDAAAIPGATGHHYTVRFADLGKVVRVRVTGTKAGYTSVTRVSTAGSPVQPGKLSPTPIPTVTGVLVVGMTLQANPGTWGPTPVNLSYQWKRDGANIIGATSPSRTVALGDRGHRLSVSVRGSKPGYLPVTRTSTQTAVVP